MGLERLLAGHLLCDRYRVDGMIGRGGMGAVYRARDVRLQRNVAVKVVTAASEVGARLRLRERFHREARAAAGLQHRNVVTVYDYGTDPRLDLDFLVMELLRGEDLASRLGRVGRPQIGVALEILAQAAQGLAAGHRVGLIHRDIKPANLFVAAEGAGGFRVCVLDFGIVQLESHDEQATATQLTMAGRAPLSPAYAAPEQLCGESRLTAATDVWGLGATAFHLLTGERPFTETEQRRLMAGACVQTRSARAINAGVPPAVDEVVSIALAHRPADRFRDAAAFAAALASARGGMSRDPASQQWPEFERQRLNPDADYTLVDPVRSAGAPGRRWGSAPRWPTAPPSEPVDGTLLETRGTPLGPSLAPAEVGPGTPPNAPANGAPARPLDGAPAERRWLRRAARVIWQTTLTAISITATAAFAAGMFRAFDGNLVEPFYASVVGLTLSTPWAIHRLFRRRGSYLLAMVGCVLVSIAVFRFLAPLTDPVVALVSLPPAQVGMAVWIMRLTRRKNGEAHPGTAVSPLL